MSSVCSVLEFRVTWYVIVDERERENTVEARECKHEYEFDLLRRWWEVIEKHTHGHTGIMGGICIERVRPLKLPRNGVEAGWT